MPLRNLIATIILGVILLSAIAGEGYFYFYSQKENNSAQSVIQSIQNALKPQSPLSALAQAKIDLETQTEKLKEMESSFPNSPTLDAAIKTDVSSASDAAARDDALVSDQKLGLSSQANIVALGQKATAAIAYLQSLSNNPETSTISLNDAAQNAVELVAAYSNEISDYINNLSAENSNLTSSEMADYRSQSDSIVAQVDSIEDSLSQTDSITAASVADNTNNNQGSSANNNQAGANSSNNSNSNFQSSSTNQGSNQPLNQTSDQGTNSAGDSVTLADITNQESVVTEDQIQVNQLADQDSANSTSSSSNNTQSPTVNDENGSNNGIYTGGNNSGGIQTQSGPVKLIEGENTF